MANRTSGWEILNGYRFSLKSFMQMLNEQTIKPPCHCHDTVRKAVLQLPIADKAKRGLGEPVPIECCLCRRSLKTAFINYLMSLSTLCSAHRQGATAPRLCADWCCVSSLCGSHTVQQDSIGFLCMLTGYCTLEMNVQRPLCFSHPGKRWKAKLTISECWCRRQDRITKRVWG